jgi:hypothetical protein
MAVSKYLARYAEPEAEIALALDGQWSQVVVIPACGEGEWIWETVASVGRAAAGSPTLVILVVNATQGAPDRFHRANRALLGALPGGGTPVAARKEWSAYRGQAGGVEVVLVDRASAGRHLPEGQGVGLARKLGVDLALALRADGRVASRWIWTTDADVVVPQTYFSGVSTAVGGSACTLPFEHVPAEDPALARTGRFYDLSLRYYVLGLAAASSPYAYHTVGSTLVVDADSYEKVRGFPKRQAGEDFYLLNKLAKIDDVHRLGGPPLQVAARVSDRVPFGTGPAIVKWAARVAEGAPMTLYDPRAFTVVAAWIAALDNFAEHCDAHRWAREVEETSGLPARAHLAIAQRLGLAGAMERAATSSGDPRVRRRHIRTWCDAFRTLKLIHAVRDVCWPDVPWQDAVGRAAFIKYAGEDLGAAHAAVLLADAALQNQRVGPSATL